jgi:predicted lipoprotein
MEWIMFLPARTLKRAFVLIVLPPALAALTSCTIVHHGAGGTAENTSAQKAAANEAFDAKAFVKTNWAKVEPEMVRDAVDIREVVAALKQDQAAAEKKYGRRKDETALFNFVVKGKEVIKSVNTESAAGTLELGLSDPSGEAGVRVQIGPVIKSSAVRDVLSFINFGDFTNQLDFANISKEINFYVRDNVVSGINRTGLVGKHLTFVGAFAEDGSGRILITPIKVEVAP